jgi:cation diffusion facilitator CzcD-associated flavoprotein CzcO
VGLLDRNRGGPLPRPSPLRVTIVGAGFGGLGMAIRLRRAGIADLTIFERAEQVGGEGGLL